MGRRKFQVSDEIAYRWCEMHRLGDSYSKIADKEEVERRLVARVVREFDNRKYLEEGDAIRREILTDFLREHLKGLEEVAWDLVELTGRLSLGEPCVYPSNVSFSFSKPNIESELINKIATQLDIKVAETRPKSLQVTQHFLEREAKTRVEDLKKHLPGVWKQVEGWGQEAAKYIENWKELRNYTENQGIPLDLFESGVKKALHLLLTSQEQENLPRIPAKLETPENIGLWMFRSAKTRESLEACRDSHNKLKVAYERLEGMLIPSQLRHALLKEKCDHCPLP